MVRIAARACGNPLRIAGHRRAGRPLVHAGASHLPRAGRTAGTIRFSPIAPAPRSPRGRRRGPGRPILQCRICGRRLAHPILRRMHAARRCGQSHWSGSPVRHHGPRSRPAFRETLMLVARQAARAGGTSRRDDRIGAVSDSPPVPAATESLEPSAAIAKRCSRARPGGHLPRRRRWRDSLRQSRIRSVFGITADKSIDDWAQAVHPADRGAHRGNLDDFSLNPRPMVSRYRVQSATAPGPIFREHWFVPPESPARRHH